MKKSTTTITAKLTDALLPAMAEWLPPAKEKLPADLQARSVWRTAPKASFNDFKLAEFIESLLKQDAQDEHLKKRWDRIAAAPLAFQSQLPGRAAWRRKRGLVANPKHVVFGVVASGNFILAEEGGIGASGHATKHALTRKEMYAFGLPALERIARRRGLIDAAGEATDLPFKAWSALADELKSAEAFPGWPEDGPKPVEFLRQFLKDVMHAALNFTNGQSGLDEVVAVEAGERRRPGNHHGLAEVVAAVAQLEARLTLP